MTFTPPRRQLLVGAVALAARPASAAAAIAPAPFGATPSPRQLAWSRMEANAFVHFTVNTFTDKEWGYGDEDPKVFAPTDFSADQIVGAAKAAGLKGVILTAKHHDGFCLWPSAFTDHSVKSSAWRGGEGDVVRDMAQACARAGLKFGVYLSPWDRNRADYGTPAYLDAYRGQLTELLTRYGPIFEVWFDGANGGDGYYGGARETRDIGGEAYYQWPKTLALVRRLQPDAVTFNAPGADVRWVGNEDGVAGDPCWPTFDDLPYNDAKLNAGVKGGPVWRPAEADVSVRKGWFWHASEVARTPENLMDLYFKSVGRGANLLLNLPPDRRGRIPDDDAAKLAAFGAARRAFFAHDLAKDARVTATSTRPGGPRFAPARATDGREDTFWAAADDQRRADLVLETSAPVVFDVVRLREPVALGVRIGRFAVQAQDPSGGWRTLAEPEAVGTCRLVRLPAPVTARRVRLRILDAMAAPLVSEFALFRQGRG